MRRVVFAPEAERQLVELYKRLAAAASAEVAGAYLGSDYRELRELAHHAHVWDFARGHPAGPTDIWLSAKSDNRF